MITLTILAAWAATGSGGALTAPQPPAPPTLIGAIPSLEPFKPYKPKSIYDTRGGVDPYPKPAKPKGYIDLFHPKTKSTFRDRPDPHIPANAENQIMWPGACGQTPTQLGAAAPCLSPGSRHAPGCAG